MKKLLAILTIVFASVAIAADTDGSQVYGTLTNGSPSAVYVGKLKLPMTITLNSAANGRQIEYSTNGGVEYVVATPDVSTATMQIVYVIVPVSHIRLTGAADDKWSIR